MNQQKFTYRLDLQEEEDRFEVQAEYRGYPAFRERDRFIRKPEGDQEQVLKEWLGNPGRNRSIRKASVQNLLEPRKPMGWKAEGGQEAVPGRTRQVHPFPGMPEPLWIPDSLPGTRADLIVLPFAFIHEASSRIGIPEGMSLRASTPLDRRNSFGRVSWQAGPGTERGTAQATFRVEVENPIQGPDQYQALKELLGWIQEAQQQVLVLEKR